MLETQKQSEIREFSFDLPPFPTTASQLVSELNGGDVQVPRIIQLIECEPTVGSKVINLANSPLYGTSRPITTIGHAVVILGFKSVAQLALTVATAGVFEGKSTSFCETRRETYSQSLAIATLARHIARQDNQANPDEAFICGVMHDIGRIVLLESVGEPYHEMVVDNPIGNTTELETESFGITHPELGRACGKKWGLPNSIVVAIAHHHFPIAEVSDPLSQAIITANYCARRWQIGFATADDFVLDEQLEAVIGSEANADLQTECIEQFDAIREICMF